MNGNCDRCGRECQLRYLRAGNIVLCNECFIKYKMFRNIEKILCSLKKSLNTLKT